MDDLSLNNSLLFKNQTKTLTESDWMFSLGLFYFMASYYYQ